MKHSSPLCSGSNAWSASAQAYQAELERKLAQAQQQPGAAQWLALRLHGVDALLPLQQIGTIFAPVALQPLPMAQNWVRGVAGWRGDLYLLIDWVRMLNLAAAPERLPLGAAPGYWVGFNPTLGYPLALQADALLGLRRAQQLLPATANATASAAAPAWRERRGVDGSAWLELDLAQWAQATALQDWLLPPFAPRRAQALASPMG